jgi:hypothetical protein
VPAPATLGISPAGEAMVGAAYLPICGSAPRSVASGQMDVTPFRSRTICGFFRARAGKHKPPCHTDLQRTLAGGPPPAGL